MMRARSSILVVATLGAMLSTGCAIGTIEGPNVEPTDDARTPTETGAAEDTSAPPPPDDDAAPPPDDTTRPPLTDTGAPDPTDTSVPPPPDTGPPPTTTYPSGPYGKTTGAVLPNLSWKGYRDSTGSWTDIALGDYYDPSGSKGIRALWLGMAAVW
jgi:hypothetical protein